MTTLVADGNNMAMRAIHAMARSDLSADGVNTGPLHVFINSISRHVREEQPDRVVVCWDSGPSRYRMGLYPAYKGTRKDAPTEIEESKTSTFSLVKEFLAVAGIHQVERPGFEADDLIAYYVHQREPTEKAVILSSDKDFLQLLESDESEWHGEVEVRRGSVEQVRLSAGGAATDRWTALRVIEEIGCRPAHLTAAMALAGDAGDNVPQVPGVGLKTAVKWLEKADWDLWSIGHPKMAEYRDQIQISYALVDLQSLPVGLVLPPIPDFEPTQPGSVMYEGLLSFLDRYRLTSTKERLLANTLWHP